MDTPPELRTTSENTTEQTVMRECAWCAAPIDLRPRARHQRYCSRNCRQRAYEVRTAAERQESDAEAGRARPADAAPVREVVERVSVRTLVRMRTRYVPSAPAPWAREPADPPLPPGEVDLRARAVQTYLEQVAAAIRDGRIRAHDHARIWRGMTAVLDALDTAHPGGMDALTGRR